MNLVTLTETIIKKIVSNPESVSVKEFDTEEENEINLSDLTARLNEKVYFAKIKDNTSLKLDLESLSKEKTLKGIFVKKMLEKIALVEDKEKYESALKLGLKAFSGEVKFEENH